MRDLHWYEYAILFEVSLNLNKQFVLIKQIKKEDLNFAIIQVLLVGIKSPVPIFPNTHWIFISTNFNTIFFIDTSQCLIQVQGSLTNGEATLVFRS